MSVSILESLQNADYNLRNNSQLALVRSIAENQLHNAVVLLIKGYGLYEQVEPLLEKYGKVENVPEKPYDCPDPTDCSSDGEKRCSC